MYIAGEVQIVSAVLRAALARGLSAEQVSPKAYWGRGKSNENNGEPGTGRARSFRSGTLPRGCSLAQDTRRARRDGNAYG